MTEHGLLLALIAVVCTVVITTLGATLAGDLSTGCKWALVPRSSFALLDGELLPRLRRPALA